MFPRKFPDPVSMPHWNVLRADLHGAIMAHATSLRWDYDKTYDCRSVLKHVFKWYDIFPDVHDNRKRVASPS